MEPGRLYDGDGSSLKGSWSKKPPRKGFLVYLGLVTEDPDDAKSIALVVYRCRSCGYLESYAPRT
jgi:hypothetical protein